MTRAFAFHTRSYDNVPCDYKELYSLKLRRLALGLSVDDVYNDLCDRLHLLEATDVDRLENGDLRVTIGIYTILSEYYKNIEEAEKERLDYLSRVQGGSGIQLENPPCIAIPLVVLNG